MRKNIINVCYMLLSIFHKHGKGKLTFKNFELVIELNRKMVISLFAIPIEIDLNG